MVVHFNEDGTLALPTDVLNTRTEAFSLSISHEISQNMNYVIHSKPYRYCIASPLFRFPVSINLHFSITSSSHFLFARNQVLSKCWNGLMENFVLLDFFLHSICGASFQKTVKCARHRGCLLLGCRGHLAHTGDSVWHSSTYWYLRYAYLRLLMISGTCLSVNPSRTYCQSTSFSADIGSLQFTSSPKLKSSLFVHLFCNNRFGSRD